ncbi:MAG: hypothetical protein JWN04_3927 [Myxococcaceae bacterium]|nr:hypothetical protein [Myxococcaceae bacterium]
MASHPDCVHPPLPVSPLNKLLRYALWLVPVLSLGLATLRTPVSAQTIVLRRPALHWVRSEEAMSCIDPRTLAEHVETLIGPVLVRPSEAEHTIEGQVDMVAPGRLRVRVRVLDAQGTKVGERQFEQPADDCAVLSPAIAFVIGMTIDPEVAAHGLPPALVALLGESGPLPEQRLLAELDKAPARQAEVSRAPVPKKKERPLVEEVERRPLQASGFLRGALGEAKRALVSVDARLLYTYRKPFSAGAYLRSGMQVGPHHVAQGDLKMAVLDGGLLSCVGQLSNRRIRVHGCVGAELSTLFVRGSGFEDGDHVRLRSAFGLVAQLTARVRLWRGWGLGILLNGRFGTPRRSFAIEDVALPGQQLGGPPRHLSVGQLPRFSGGVGIGPTYEF